MLPPPSEYPHYLRWRHQKCWLAIFRAIRETGVGNGTRKSPCVGQARILKNITTLENYFHVVKFDELIMLNVHNIYKEKAKKRRVRIPIN